MTQMGYASAVRGYPARKPIYPQPGDGDGSDAWAEAGQDNRRQVGSTQREGQDQYGNHDYKRQVGRFLRHCDHVKGVSTVVVPPCWKFWTGLYSTL
jgi:hypothetical protein